MNRSNRTKIWASIAALLFVAIGFSIERHQTSELLITYSALFAVYLLLVHDSKWELKNVLIVGLIFRLILLFSHPVLSDDFYRFLWDGQIWRSGINPFAHLPSDFFDGTVQAPAGLSETLFEKINSKNHFTVYPTIPQLINLAAASLFPNSTYWATVIMKIPLLIAELGSFYFLSRLVATKSSGVKLIALYFLNPLVIIEIIGNAHHEGLMICFLLGFIHWFKRSEYGKASIMFALAVASKLLPLMFLPLVLLDLGKSRGFRFGVYVIIAGLILLLPLLDASFITGMSESLSLYYQKLEFNASFYFLVREFGFWVKGYNIIETSGRVFALFAFLGILMISIISRIKRWQLETSLLFIYLLFCLTSLILHPWYILLLIPLGLLTGYYFPIVWSYLIFLTYAGYTQSGYVETPTIFWLEYVILAGVLFFEIRNKYRIRIKAAGL